MSLWLEFLIWYAYESCLKYLTPPVDPGKSHNLTFTKSHLTKSKDQNPRASRTRVRRFNFCVCSSSFVNENKVLRDRSMICYMTGFIIDWLMGMRYKNALVNEIGVKGIFLLSSNSTNGNWVLIFWQLRDVNLQIFSVKYRHLDNFIQSRTYKRKKMKFRKSRKRRPRH